MQNPFQKNFDQIDGTDITNLIDTKYKERQGMEYKREMYGRSDPDRKELLRDISSIANAYGGYLIVGIETDDNEIPVQIVNVVDAETERDRIEQLCLASIEPRIPGLRTRVIRLNTGEDIIIIMIPRSIRKPHMITHTGLNQFWIRHNDKKGLMSIEEIRDACINIDRLQRDIKEFLVERDNEIRGIIGGAPFLVLGSSPSIISEDRVVIDDPALNRFLISPPHQTKLSNLSFELFDRPEAYPEPTLNGLKIFHPAVQTVELFRTGYYEARIPADLFSFPREKKVCLHHEQITSYVVNYFRALDTLVELLGIEETIVVFVSLFNIQGIVLEGVRAIGGVKQKLDSPWKELNLRIPPKQVYSKKDSDKLAKLFSDRIWNAFGFTEAPYFNDGRYTK
jgi:hypothetical protein